MKRKKGRLRKSIITQAAVAATVAVVIVFVVVRRPRSPLHWRTYYGVLPPLVPRNKIAAAILAGARAQIGNRYNARYRIIAYPNGDVPAGAGACTDVVVRALRHAGFDLQKLIHLDMQANFARYPHKWGLPGPDTNIDHRRVLNQMCFFKRHGTELTTIVSPLTLKQWQPADIVCWSTGRTTHTGIVSSTRNAYGEPYVVDDGYICVEEDALTKWPIIGHYRYPK